MIQENELRVNNYILFPNGEPYKMTKTDFIFFLTSDFGDQYKPIELTEEILLKCGFKHKGGGFYIHCKSLIELCNVSDKFFVVGFKDVSLGNIYYLHQLQNLYFALTGQELEINF